MAISRDAQTGLNVAGGAVQGVGSMFGPYGALIGGVVGGGMSLMSQMLGEAPEVKGPSGGQRAAASMALQNASDIASRQGMSSAQVSRMRQLSGMDEAAQLQMLNVLEKSENLSPLAKEQIAKGVIKDVAKQQANMKKQLANLDIAAEREREQSLIAATDNASRTATVVQQTEQRQQALEDAWEQTRWQNFNKGMTGIAEFAGGMGEYLQENPNAPKWSWTQPTKEERQDAVDKKVAQSSGIASAFDGLGDAFKADPYLSSIDSLDVARDGMQSEYFPMVEVETRSYGDRRKDNRADPIYTGVYTGNWDTVNLD